MAGTPQRTDINFEEFRKLLLKERARVSKVEQAIRAGIIAETQDSSETELSSYPTFGDSENYDNATQLADRDRDIAADANERDLLARIDTALERIDEGTYGICEVTGQPIPVARLRALPWATMTVEAAERQGL